MKAAAQTIELDPRQLTPARGPVLKRVSIANLVDARPELPGHAVEHILPLANVTLLGAHGGSGKSILALAISAHVACGRAWAGLKALHGRAVFVSLEDPPDVVRYRLSKICNAYELPLPTDDHITILDGTQTAAAMVTEIIAGGVRELVETEVMAEVREATSGATLVVIDNASDAFDADENHRRSVRAFMRKLAEIARASGAAVLLLAHIDKAAARTGASGNSYSGSTAWHNSARSRLALIEGGPGVPGVELVHEKANNGRRIGSLLLRFDEHGVLVPGIRDEATSADEQLFHFLARAIKDGEIFATTRTGPTNAHSVARSLPGFPEEFADARAFWPALARLQKSGRIEREVYRNDQRKQRERWAIAQVAQVRARETDATSAPPAQVLALGGTGEPAHPGTGAPSAASNWVSENGTCAPGGTP